MTLMKWDNSLSVGVKELDDQHKLLIDLINDAYAAIQQHDERLLCELIDKMSEYAELHFATEEGYMKKYGFPELSSHQFKHAKFKSEVEQFKKNQFDKLNFSKIFVFLSRWLTTHIMEEDMQYVQYLPKEEGAENQE